MKLSLVWLYPDLMDTYGDRGNIIALKSRAEKRGIDFEIINNLVGEDLPPQMDLLFMGGAQDRQQMIVMADLKGEKGDKIIEMVEGGLVSLFVCAGFQMMGKYYKAADGEHIETLGLFDMQTTHPGLKEKRLIGNVVVNNLSFTSDKDKTLVGFENHGGRTFLGPKEKPLGRIVVGFGNNGEDRTEGIHYKNAIGSYFHGPILPKNPHLADHLLLTALLNRGYTVDKLMSLDDELEWQAHDYAKKLALSH